MSYIDWNEWNERKEYIKQHKQDLKTKVRNLLESNAKSMEISLKQFIDMLEEEEHYLDSLDLLEEALMRIADGQTDPQEIALAALKKYRGDDE